MTTQKKLNPSDKNTAIETDPAFELLLTSWPALRRETRSDAVYDLVESGYTKREIARELTARGRKVDEKTIRNDYEYACKRRKSNVATDSADVRAMETVKKTSSVATQPTGPAEQDSQTASETYRHYQTREEWIEMVHAGVDAQMRDYARLNTLTAEAMRYQVQPRNPEETYK